ncbi:MAG: DEAD/DEAH box helicase [Candidatus Omnitrophica bacterium]|nr:DEAD/DEAH box helicase [Candidatus Omnitrophota bacterium]
MGSFEGLGLSQETLKVLQQKGFEVPTSIQEKIIPKILGETKDLIGQAQTGTGKTAAFGLPILELLPEKNDFVQVLVLTPTRELAIQVAEEINSLKGKKKLSIAPIYGGQSIDLQFRRLRKGVDIVVGTPGRVLDHIRRKTLKLSKVSYLVLDEADEMLNMGFQEEINAILEHTNKEKRTLLFSATMPNEILKIAKKYMGNYDVFKGSKGNLTNSRTDQIYFEVSKSDRFEALCRIIDIEDNFYSLVFCRTKVDVDTISNHLMDRGYDAEGLHGDMSQSHRERILNKFKKRVINILVATDVAARGIDVQDLTHVINYSLPHGPEAYVHRIGRTGRAGKEGIAITFITSSEYKKLQYIIRVAKTDIRKAKLPKVKDVINTKKLRIRSYLDNAIKSGISDKYMDLSRDLLAQNTPENVLAALLQHSFKKELDSKGYSNINERVVDSKGTTRLFVTQGKKDGLTRKKLINFIKEKTNINGREVEDIKILDKFSFITLPFNEAETVLASFKKGKKRSNLVIQKAKK